MDTQLVPVKKTGRKKNIGALDFSTGEMKWVFAYCPDCHAKILGDLDALHQISREIPRSQHSLQAKLIRRILKHFS